MSYYFEQPIRDRIGAMHRFFSVQPIQDGHACFEVLENPKRILRIPASHTLPARVRNDAARPDNAFRETDRDLGKRFPEILIAGGLITQAHASHFPADCPDERTIWLDAKSYRKRELR